MSDVEFALMLVVLFGTYMVVAEINLRRGYLSLALLCLAAAVYFLVVFVRVII